MAKKLISYDDEAEGLGLPEVVEAKLEGSFVQSTASTDTLILGTDLVTPSGWTLGTGWSGDLATGFVHTPTGGGALEWALPALSPTGTYLLSVTVDGHAANNNFPGDITISIAGVSLHPLYRGANLLVQTYRRAFMPIDSSPLSITIKSTTPATVIGVTLVEVTGEIPATSTWRAPDGEPSIELRTTGTKSVFLGLDAGQRHQGDNSVGIGAGALENDITGFFNVAVGMDALKASRRVSRNVAVGYQALAENQGGDRNVAVGPFSGHRISTGNENTLLGVDTLWQSATGSRNVGVGLYALGNADTSDQIAIGNSAIRYATSGEQNIGIGSATLGQAATGVQNVAVGRAALNRNTGDKNVAVGSLSSYFSSGSYNVAIGTEALHGGSGSTPSETVAVGHRAGTAVTSGTQNTMVGYSSGWKLTEGSRNTVVGHLSAEFLTSGADNIVVGWKAGNRLTTGSRNILIGGSLPEGRDNDVINVGNLFYGNRNRGTVGVGVTAPEARLHLAGSVAGTNTAPLRFTAGDLIPTPTNGSMEFDGTNLYITIGGVRQKIAFVTPEPEA